MVRDHPRACGKDTYDRIELRAGAPLTLNLVTSWFGGMTSSFVIVNLGVIDQNLFFIRLMDQLYAATPNRLLYRHVYRRTHKALAGYMLRLTTL